MKSETCVLSPLLMAQRHAAVTSSGPHELVARSQNAGCKDVFGLDVDDAGDMEGGGFAGQKGDEAMVHDGPGVDLVNEQGEVAQEDFCCHCHVGTALSGRDIDLRLLRC